VSRSFGPLRLELRGYLVELRRSLGLGPARFVPVPRALVTLAAEAARLWPGAWLEPESWRMLQRGNVGDACTLTRLFGRSPRPVARFVEAAKREGLAMRARLDTTLPLLRASVAALWIATAPVSFDLYLVADSRHGAAACRRRLGR